MTNDERDKYILETHDKLVELVPVLKDMKKTVYGDGNGIQGLNSRTLMLETAVLQAGKDLIDHEIHCDARKAVSIDQKRINLAKIAMVLSTVSLIVTTFFTILKYLEA